MAATDYRVTAAGDRKIMHNGVACHAGRLVNLDSANAVTAFLLQIGYITATLGGATIHDVASGTPTGQQAAEALTTYHVTAAGAQHISHNGVTLAQGAAIALDSLDDTAKTYLAQGWIS